MKDTFWSAGIKPYWLNPVNERMRVLGYNSVMSQAGVLRLERGGEHVVLACCTKTNISLLIYKVS